MKAFLRAAALAATLALGACMTIADAPAGPYKVSKTYQVTLSRQWSDLSPIMIGQPKTVKLLTIDGPGLNRLYLTDGLAPGGYIIKPAKKELPTPTYRTGMSPNELAEFLVDNVAALEFEKAEMTGLRPAKFGASDALRVDIKAVTQSGLQIMATGLIAESGGKLYVILYIAPAEHYYGAALADVEAVMASAKAGD